MHVVVVVVLIVVVAVESTVRATINPVSILSSVCLNGDRYTDILISTNHNPKEEVYDHDQ